MATAESITDHDAYIAAAPEAFHPVLSRLRRLLAEALPDAHEIIAYGMPGFQIGRTVVASYAAFSKQCGVYFLPGAITAHADVIATAGFKATKTGVTFTTRSPIPDGLVHRLATASQAAATV